MNDSFGLFFEFVGMATIALWVLRHLWQDIDRIWPASDRQQACRIDYRPEPTFAWALFFNDFFGRPFGGGEVGNVETTESANRQGQP